jgi:hypothetical protein
MPQSQSGFSSSPVSNQSGPITSQISPIFSQSNPIEIDKQQIETTTPIPEDFVDQNEDLIIRFNHVLANLQPNSVHVFKS